MYESITYSELKKLPKDEKSNAWKELSALCSTKKELAVKLGVSPAIVYNMISKYVDGKPIGRGKVEKREAVQETKKVARRAKTKKNPVMPENQTITENEINEIRLVPQVTGISDVPSSNDSFSMAVKRTVSGEDAQSFLNGIVGTLLKNQKYIIEINIIEK